VDQDNKKDVRKLIYQGKLREARAEVFGKGVLDMLESGEFYNLTLSSPN
jgi:hypothetical protein